MAQLVWYSLIAGTLSLIGGLFVIWRSKLAVKFITPLITFGAGAFLAVAFLDLLPEAVEALGKPHPVFMAALTGYVIFFTFERLLMRLGHSHTETKNHNDHTESLPILIIVGDTFHNILDGIVLALAFVANPLLGLPTALAIAAHEVPQEIGDFAILLDQGWSKMKIFIWNIISSLGTIIGAIIGYAAIGFFQDLLPYFLAGAAGIFTYIAASNIVPEIHHRAGHAHFFRIIIPFLIGLIFVGYLVIFAH